MTDKLKRIWNEYSVEIIVGIAALIIIAVIV